MFCPLCQAEYREGFTQCKDCNVELVASLPPGTEAELPFGESKSQGRFLAWFIPMAAFYLSALVLMAVPSLAGNEAFILLLAALVLVGNFGIFWMLYQVIRFEKKMFPMVIYSFVPFAFVWYYSERYRRRAGNAQVQIPMR